MSQSATLQINETGYGQPAFANTLNYSFSTSPLAIQNGYTFASGFQTITPPDGAVGVVITNVDGTLEIKGDNGDTGYTIDTTDFPCLLPVPTFLTLTAVGSSVTADLCWF